MTAPGGRLRASRVYRSVTLRYTPWPTTMPTLLSSLSAVRPRSSGLLPPNASTTSWLRAGCWPMGGFRAAIRQRTGNMSFLMTTHACRQCGSVCRVCRIRCCQTPSLVDRRSTRRCVGSSQLIAFSGPRRQLEQSQQCPLRWWRRQRQRSSCAVQCGSCAATSAARVNG